MSSLVKFIGSLKEGGEVTVSPEGGIDLGGDLTEPLRQMDRIARLNLPGEAPSLDLATASWAAYMLYGGCQLIVNRSLDEKSAKELFRIACPSPHSASTDYSADLMFQYLPDLCRLGKRLSPIDPVNQLLLELAKDWPLSSVGVESVDDVNIDSFIGDPCLCQLYVDRILERKHHARARDPRVAQAIRESVGAYPELCPSFNIDPEKGEPCLQPQT